MKPIVVCIVCLLTSVTAWAGPRCAKAILDLDKKLIVKPHPQKPETLQLQLRTKNGSLIDCADQPKGQLRQIRHVTRLIETSTTWTVEDLISFATLSWPDLALSASQHLVRRSAETPEIFTTDQTERIGQIMLEDKPTRKVAWQLSRSLGQLASPVATRSLDKILKLGGSADYRVYAAKTLGKIGSPLALAALQRCIKLEDIDVSKICKRILLERKIKSDLERKMR